jgi:uncharacterized membrane protein YdbT with pleckstrin-like domain
MPYPQDYLHDQEDLVLHLHPHWWFFAKSAAGLVVSIVFGVVVLVVAGGDGAVTQGLRVFAAVLVLASLVWFVVRYVKWVSTHFVLTTDRVIYRSGIIAKEGIEIPLERINQILFKQRLFERMLGLGDIMIESAAKEGAQVFNDIKSPNRVQNEIYIQMENNDSKKFDRLGARLDQTAAMAPAAAAPTVPQQIEHLNALRQSGAITEEEYQAKKTELLGRM